MIDWIKCKKKVSKLRKSVSNAHNAMYICPDDTSNRFVTKNKQSGLCILFSDIGTSNSLTGHSDPGQW